VAEGVEVRPAEETDDGWRFEVRVRSGGSESAHRVTLRRDDLEELAGAGADPEAFVRRCFGFLLEREPKESILSEFDVRVIGRYFPEFREEIRDA
jgi:hypothetical protein